jgi:hypothetical protein
VIAPEERKIEGRWWVEGSSGPSYFGTLTSSRKKLQLIVKIPQDLTIDEAMLQTVDAPDIPPDVILGRNAYNQPITLFGCFCRPETREGLKTLRIDAIAAIDGLEVADWNQPAIRTALIQIDPISIWLGGQALIATNKNGKEGFTLPSVTDLSFQISEGVELGIWCSTGISSSQEKVSFTQGSSVWLQFDRPRSVQEISDDWVPWVDRLFSLLIGSGIRHQSVTCHEDKFFGENSKPLGKKGELIRKGGRAPTRADEISLLDMVTRYSELSDNFGKIIAKWTEVADRYEALVDLFSIAAFNRSLHTQAEFLFLVQALEVYHARSPSFDSMLVAKDAHKARVERAVTAVPDDLKDWVERTLRAANNKHLDVRLSEIFKLHLNESTKIFGSDPSLAEKIRYTRNHLTHHTGDETSPKLLTRNHLVQVSWNLRTFIWVCLLKEIGVCGAPIDRLIRKYEAYFVSLN